MEIGWKGERSRLVPLESERHLENAMRWINDPEVTQFLIAGDFPMTRLAEREWFETQSRNNEGTITFAIETLEGKHIGFSGIFDIHWRHGTAVTGSLIGDKEEWGKGYGSDSANTRSRYAFDVLGLRMLYSGVFEGNSRSLAMLKHAGYQECGRLPKKVWKRGEYRDEIQMFLDRETWLSLGAPV